MCYICLFLSVINFLPTLGISWSIECSSCSVIPQSLRLGSDCWEHRSGGQKHGYVHSAVAACRRGFADAVGSSKENNAQYNRPETILGSLAEGLGRGRGCGGCWVHLRCLSWLSFTHLAHVTIQPLLVPKRSHMSEPQSTALWTKNLSVLEQNKVKPYWSIGKRKIWKGTYHNWNDYIYIHCSYIFF